MQTHNNNKALFEKWILKKKKINWFIFKYSYIIVCFYFFIFLIIKKKTDIPYFLIGDESTQP